MVKKKNRQDIFPTDKPKRTVKENCSDFNSEVETMFSNSCMLFCVTSYDENQPFQQSIRIILV